MTAPSPQCQPKNPDAPVTILRGWAKAYRDSPEHRFPSDPHAEFFPVDMDAAADRIEELEALLEFWIYDGRLQTRAALPQPTSESVRRCKHDVSEDCPACAEETIAGLKAELAEWKQAAGVEAGLRREFSARVEELEAKTALVTFNEACKRIEELEAALRIAREAVWSGGDTLKAIAVIDKALPRPSDLARAPINPEGN